MANWSRQIVNDDGFWQKCLEHGVEPSGVDAKYRVSHVHTTPGIRGYVKLIDDKSGIGPDSSQFVLMSDQLSSQIVQRLAAFCQTKHLSSGYLIRDALDYETVYLVDPNQHFSDDDRVVFIENDRTLIEISGGTADELAQDLESKVS